MLDRRIEGYMDEKMNIYIYIYIGGWMKNRLLDKMLHHLVGTMDV